MRPLKKWLLISVGGGVLVAAGVLFSPDPFFLWDNYEEHALASKVLEGLFWPVPVCLYLSGPGAAMGAYLNGKMRYEATPIQVIAASLGFGLSWTFYTSFPFFVGWIRRKSAPGSPELKDP